MDPARPIEFKDQDAFERSNFVKHLASFLCLDKDEPSIVVGIEAKWGEGKTSCINLAKNILKENSSRPIIVDYQPWLISTLDSVIEGFFLALASALGIQSNAQNAASAAHKVLQFGKMFAPIKLIPGVEPWGSVVESVFSAVGSSAKAGSELANLSLEARKIDLQKSLRRVNRPIVVVIDDVDRLSPEHVCVVFQMLKAVCDFDRVSYLIAYDPQPVIDALSYRGVYDGKRYLEKLVQISYQLPRLSFTHMKDYTQNHIQRLMEKCSIELTGADKDLFGVLLNRTDLIRAMETPRDVIRLCNRLRLSGPNTLNEVSFPDLVAFEMLELKFPELTKIIRTEPEIFVEKIRIDREFFTENTVAEYHLAFNKGSKEKEVIKPLDALLQRVKYTDREKEIIATLLIFMFPHLAGKDYSERGIPEDMNRVRNRDAFLKILHCGTASFTLSVDQVKRFYTKPEERHQIFLQYFDRNYLLEWFTYLSKFTTSLADCLIEPVGLCDFILQETRGIDLHRSQDNLLYQVGIFLYEVIKEQKERTIRHEMLDSLVSSVTCLALSETTLTMFLIDYGIFCDGKYLTDKAEAKTKAIGTFLNAFSYDELYAAKDRWLTSVREAVASQDFLENQKGIIGVFFRWGQLNDNDFSEVQAYVMKQSTDSQWLEKFVSLFDNDLRRQEILRFIPNESFDEFVRLTEALPNTRESVANINNFLLQVQMQKKT